MKFIVLLFIVCSLWAQDGKVTPSVPDSLRADAYRALANLTAVKLAIAQAQALMPEAQKAFDVAQKTLLESCGADFQMDQDALKQERFVCIAKPAALATPVQPQSSVAEQPKESAAKPLEKKQ